MVCNFENPFGCCADCCTEIGKEIVVKGFVKIGTSIMHALDVKAMKHKLEWLQENAPKAFSALISKCIDETYVFPMSSNGAGEAVDAIVKILVINKLVTPDGMGGYSLAEDVKDVVFALVVDENSQFLSQLVDDSNGKSIRAGTDQRCSRRMSLSVMAISDKRPNLFKILDSKDALRRKTICEASPEEADLLYKSISSRHSSMCSNNGAAAASAKTSGSSGGTGSIFASMAPFDPLHPLERTATVPRLPNHETVCQNSAGARPSALPSAAAAESGASSESVAQSSGGAARQGQLGDLADQLLHLLVTRMTLAPVQQPAGVQAVQASTQSSGDVVAVQSSTSHLGGARALQRLTQLTAREEKAREEAKARIAALELERQRRQGRK